MPITAARSTGAGPMRFPASRALKGQSAQVLWFVAALGVWQLANVVYPAIWTYFAIAAYGLSTKAVGIALAVVGLTAALFQGWACAICCRAGRAARGHRRRDRWAFRRWPMPGRRMSGRSIWRLPLAPFRAVLPSISAMNSRAVDARSQGELQGAVQSIGSIAQIIGPPLYAQTLARFSGPGAVINLPTMPVLVAAAIAGVACPVLKGAAKARGPRPGTTGT
jgi:DHA1 family tetracycline resistance protein-like MFS transporter